ncbi:MAG TPA: PepSY domain-containing protein [Acetobacteraceae bacterium]|nr:PepSY domain-containing protein [Acetobacteraceae bacterium]
MHAKTAVSALAIAFLGFAQAAYPAGSSNSQTALAKTVLHHSLQSEAQQNAAEASLRCAAQARVSPQQAISVVARQTRGSVVEASFVMNGGMPSYAVRAVTGSTLWRGYVSADSGAIRDGTAVAAADKAVDPGEKMQIRLVKRTKLPIGRAIGLAEHAVGGRVLDALLVDARGRPEYQMQILTSGAIQSVVVDPAGGTVHLVG